MFNALQFYKDYNIKFKDSGKNVSKGWINIKCPFHDDSDYHLGFNLAKSYFYCWSCSGISIYNVIKKLTPNENVNEIIKQYETNFIISDLIKKKLNYQNTSIKVPGDKLSNIHKQYLRSRNFDPEYLENKYKLKGTLMDKDYPYRLIIPIFHDNEIVTYQTRGLKEEDRYINCNPKLEIIPIKHTIYNLDNCNESWVIITEGCFKVFRLGDNTCACFGKNFENKQVQLLTRFEKVFIYFDNDKAGEAGANKLSSLLDDLNIETYIIKNIAPDNLSEKEAKEIKQEIERMI